MYSCGPYHGPATLPPEKEPLVPTGEESVWVLQPVWTLWRRESSPVPCNCTLYLNTTIYNGIKGNILYNV
jgi:hypothetical protein